MRTPEYYSPSSLSTWLNNPRDFYLKYLADERPPREAQTQPMAVGSSFDAYIKCYLASCLWGEGEAEAEVVLRVRQVDSELVEIAESPAQQSAAKRHGFHLKPRPRQ